MTRFVDIRWQGEVPMEIRNFKGFKYYINSDCDGIINGQVWSMFSVDFLISDKPVSKEDIKKMVVDKLLDPNAPRKRTSVKKVSIREVTNTKKYN